MPSLIVIAALFVPVALAADDRVPAWVIQLPESTPTVFIAETSLPSFHRFDRAGDTVIRAGQDYLSIGLGGAGKTRAGDQRTPLGIYFVTEQLDTARLHEKYGATAFPLDYPNAWDRRLGRTGDGIWVHGVDVNGGRRPPRDTDGCLALPNERLLELEASFEPNVTPVIIGTQMDWAERRAIAGIRERFADAVDKWSQALESGDMAAWLDAYDPGFQHLGMNKDDWVAFSLLTVGQRPIVEVAVSDLLLLADPVEEGLYLSRFLLEVAEQDGRRVTSIRRMYWRRSASGAFTIIAQDAG